LRLGRAVAFRALEKIVAPNAPPERHSAAKPQPM
jgi:hypothetical protein